MITIFHSVTVATNVDIPHQFSSCEEEEFRLLNGDAHSQFVDLGALPDIKFVFF